MHNSKIFVEFIATYGITLAITAFTWSLLLSFLFACTWRRRRTLLNKLLTLATTTTFVGTMVYLPFIALALAAKWGWF